MKKLDVGQTIGILANVGVIVGIIGLLFELDQNSEAQKLQARAVLLAIRAEDQRAISTNAGGLADLYMKASSGENLTSTEAWQLEVDRGYSIQNFAAMDKEVLEGNLDEDDIPLVQWRGAFGRRCGLADTFDDIKADLDPRFVKFIERNVVGR